MSIPADFDREALYAPAQWYVHDVLEIDPDAGRVVGLLDTQRLGALVEAQQPWPAHPRHVPGAVMIQMTGTLGNLHAVYVLGLRPTEGWVGFGTHIQRARFPKLGRIGPPVVAQLQCTRSRVIRKTWFLDYTFTFQQEEQLIYASEQTAAWVR